MEGKNKNFNLEISDIFEPDQEDRVIEVINPYINREYKDLKEHFKATDTIEVKNLSQKEADEVQENLKDLDVTFTMYNPETSAEQTTEKQIKCPRCGNILEVSDWRCPECYYEFPDYEYKDEE